MEIVRKYVNASVSSITGIDFDGQSVIYHFDNHVYPTDITIDNYNDAIAIAETYIDEMAKHYMLGLIYRVVSEFESAIPHFEIVYKTIKCKFSCVHEYLIECYQNTDSYFDSFKAWKMYAQYVNSQQVHCTCFHPHIDEDDVDIVAEKFTDLMYECDTQTRENEQLKKRIEELEAHIKYAPDGEGYIEAKEEFDELVMK
jgi:hypothetical protein